MVIMVRHPTGRKLYSFMLPEQLQPFAEHGACCLCDTRRGLRKGRIVSISEEHSAQRSIVGIWVNVNLFDIWIPQMYAESNPKRSKIEKRIQEFRTTGRFHTSVTGTPMLCDEKYIIRLDDGYSAYVASKLLGLKDLDVLVKG